MDKMLGLNSFLHPQIPSFSGTPLLHPQPTTHSSASFPLKTSKKTHPRLLFAQINNNNNLTQEPKEPEQEKKNGSANNSGGSGDDLKQDQPPPLFDIKWGDLLLNPDPDNILAVGLTGLLSWASVQVLWQLFIIAFAILVAALKNYCISFPVVELYNALWLKLVSVYYLRGSTKIWVEPICTLATCFNMVSRSLFEEETTVTYSSTAFWRVVSWLNLKPNSGKVV
ncbi:hypothetical protein SADUNF_Sadunf10G0182100 [Salix dunnii]|uniref:Uncharacterized protein n=1 Tax=Salix dunnii TaxID=1413687 RepID=A0A835MVG9_9ROSI|nr:hypothetical protein SADUNF_Sadunf10G0182100 [Salix dunnii]